MYIQEPSVHTSLHEYSCEGPSPLRSTASSGCTTHTPAVEGYFMSLLHSIDVCLTYPPMQRWHVIRDISTYLHIHITYTYMSRLTALVPRWQATLTTAFMCPERLRSGCRGRGWRRTRIRCWKATYSCQSNIFCLLQSCALRMNQCEADVGAAGATRIPYEFQ
jgi:hypothetical protein